MKKQIRLDCNNCDMYCCARRRMVFYQDSDNAEQAEESSSGIRQRRADEPDDP